MGRLRGKDGGLRAKAPKVASRLITMLVGLGAAAFLAFGVSAPARAGDVQVAFVTPALMSPELEAQRLRPAFSGPTLTNELLTAYVTRQQELQQFSAFEVPAELTEEVLLGYIARTRPNSAALMAIDSFATQPALNPELLESYAANYVPTVRKVKTANDERLCLTQAIYHEARGESEKGQWAVANIIINRALSNKYPATLCGVVFQNADNGYHRCQFTFACDGRSDMGTERAAWNRAAKMAALAYDEFRQGETPGVLPKSALFYHTTAVNPSWSDSFKPVAAIGSHIFYAKN